MKRAWIILVALAALGLLFVFGCKPRKAAEDTLEQQTEQPASSAIPEGSVSAPQSSVETPSASQSQQAQTSVGKGEPSNQPSGEATSESATSSKTEQGLANPDVKTKAIPFKAPVAIKALKIKKVDEEQEDQEDQ